MKNILPLFVFILTSITTTCFGQVRPDLVNDFTPAERATLVDLMQQYITAEIVNYHCDYINLSGEPNIHDDFNFLPFHRVYMEGMEDFFILNGHPEFVPVPSWDPTTPTPIEFQVVDADCLATSCTINVGSGIPSSYCNSNIDWDPNVSLPNYLQLPEVSGSGNDLCDHAFSPTVPGGVDPIGLSRAIETPYHNEVHINMGGNMASFASPASPIFWSWHAYLDDLWKEWECECPQSTTDNVDLYIKDNTYVMLNIRDRGEEPSIDPGPSWESGDIWIRNQQDGFTNDEHEDVVYSSTAPVYVYVRVRNRGCQPSLGTETLSLHWAKGTTALTWPNFWDGSTNGYALMGDLINTQNISAIDAQGSVIMEYQWFPPDPEDYVGNNSEPTHFVLLARQVSTNDPMTFPEAADVVENLTKNNNIAWKNIEVINTSALPIELVSFSGEMVRDQVQLSWQTNSEDQNKGFEIYRSANSQSWEKIGWVDGNGSSTQKNFYGFDDLQPMAGINYYRLKQIDFDGAFEYSEIIALENDKPNFDIRVFPNPSNGNFNLHINNPLQQRMKIQIHDNLGMRVWESKLMSDELNWRKELAIDKNGIYIITVQLGDEIYNERIVILD